MKSPCIISIIINMLIFAILTERIYQLPATIPTPI
jgi:hypothetical protein